MKCCYCSAEMVEDVTTYFKQIESTIVVVKNVPCYKCVQCGETEYSASVTKRVEQIAKLLRKSRVELAVVNFSAED